MFLKRKRNEIQHILEVGLTVRYFIGAILQFYDLLLLALSELATEKRFKNTEMLTTKPLYLNCWVALMIAALEYLNTKVKKSL